MTKFIGRSLVNAVVLIALAGLFPKMIYVDNLLAALVVGVVLTFLNATLTPLLQFFALPLTVLTLGLFALVINGLTLAIAISLSGGAIMIASFWSTIICAIIITFVQRIVGNFFQNNVK
ncbi:phage holin family protein [Holzapfeliella sp. He02]|uniref:Phage holin family protein n=1 Tax=Holzapfeliella saturejae TaxID=3082953 RepID=A0ABU8SH13_9LACO